MAQRIADRIIWAIDMLDVQPDDHVLEIGSGTGIAASLVADRFERGTYTGIDRSTRMVEQAVRRNSEAVAGGLATFFAGSVDEAELERQQFDKIFLINVNLHLNGGARDFVHLQGALAPGGKFLAVNHPPSESKARAYVSQMPTLLAEAGFEVSNVFCKRFRSGLAVAVEAC